MIIKYDCFEETMFAGSAKEIKALYKSMYRAWENSKTNLMPIFSDKARFNMKKRLYGVIVNYTEMTFCVINGESVLRYVTE